MNFSKYKHIVSSLVAGGLLLVGLFLLLNVAPQIARADPGDLFVTPGGSGDCSQANPCDLQTALSTTSDGDTVYVAGGTYTGSGGAVITVTHSITLYGGWDGTTTTPPVRDPDAHPTTLDGEGARRVAQIVGPVTVTLEGFTIANGKTISTTATGWDGPGLYARDVALTLRHTNFYSNVVDVHDATDSYAYGGGAYVEGGTLQVFTSTFRANSAWASKSSNGGGLAISGTLTAAVTDSLFQDNDAWNGGGLYFLGDSSLPSPLMLSDSIFLDNGRGRSSGRAYGGYAGAVEIVDAQAHIEGNTFKGNRANNAYGAVAVFYSDLLFARNVVYDNECGRTSGLYLYSVSPFTVTNNIIAGNRSNYTWLKRPAVFVRGGDGQFLHNTVARNASAYGLQVDVNAVAALTNTILVSHTVGINVTNGSTATLEGTLWGSGSWANGTDWGGDGDIFTGTVNIWGDPAFVNPDGGDYHIGLSSAAIDAGVDAGVTADIDGDSRPQESGYDIGADEYAIYAIYLPLLVRNYQP